MSPISNISPAATTATAPRANGPAAAGSTAGLNGALQSGVGLINSASAELDQDAAEIADPAAPDLTAPLLDLNQSKFMAEAGAAVVRASDRMLGSILDAFA
jgi:membrane protease subunit (stomatin/prohibitin family)